MEEQKPNHHHHNLRSFDASSLIVDLAAQHIPWYRSSIWPTGSGYYVPPLSRLYNFVATAWRVRHEPQDSTFCCRHFRRAAPVPPMHQASQAEYASESPLSDSSVLSLATAMAERRARLVASPSLPPPLLAIL